jgi:5-formyltetrahydrofolate cyclo-ligase
MSERIPFPNVQSLANTPDLLRKQMLHWRSSQSESDLAQRFARILDHIISWSIYQRANHILAYFGKISSGEFTTVPLLNHILKSRKNLYLPKCAVGRIALEIFHITDLFLDLAPGQFGLMEPRISNDRQVQLKQIDLIFVPGIVFDQRGFRYGYGRGYYDRLLQEKKPSYLKTVAFCDSRQIMPFNLQINEWDIPVDFLISEKGIMSTH